MRRSIGASLLPYIRKCAQPGGLTKNVVSSAHATSRCVTAEGTSVLLPAHLGEEGAAGELAGVK